jgi:hypothetical protein
MPPLAPGFSDEEAAILYAAARAIPYERRGEFLRMVAAALQEEPTRSAGSVLQAAARAQRTVLAAAVGPRSVRSTS